MADPFDDIDPQLGAPARPAHERRNDPFSDLDPFPDQKAIGFDRTWEQAQTSAVGAFARGAERSLVPTIFSLPTAAAGAEALSFAGVPGMLAGGIIGGLGGGYLGGKAQDFALSHLPASWTEKIGMDDRQQKLDEQYHGTASFLGGLAPFALTMKPGGFRADEGIKNLTGLQRVLANPLTSRVFSGAVMGGLELGQEKLAGEQPDWAKIAISTGFGVVFNRTNPIGQTLEKMGGMPVRQLLGRPEPEAVRAAAEAARRAEAERAAAEAAQKAEAARTAQFREGMQQLTAAEAEALEKAGPPPTGVTRAEWDRVILEHQRLGKNLPVTVAEANDVGVMGPGNTEATHQGSQQRSPESQQAATEQRQLEISVLGRGPEEAARVDAAARAAHPDLFEEFDGLRQRYRELQRTINDINNPPDEAIATATGVRDDIQRQLDAHLAANPTYPGLRGRQLRADLRIAEGELQRLNERRQAFTEGRAEQTADLVAARQELARIDNDIGRLSPRVNLALREAAERHGAEVVEHPPVEPGFRPAAAAPVTEAPVTEARPAEEPEMLPGLRRFQEVNEAQLEAAYRRQGLSEEQIAEKRAEREAQRRKIETEYDAEMAAARREAQARAEARAPEPEAPAPAVKPLDLQLKDIAAHYSYQLVRTGTPKALADIEGVDMAARYRLRSTYLDPGNPDRLYRAESAEILRAGQRSRQPPTGEVAPRAPRAPIANPSILQFLADIKVRPTPDLKAMFEDRNHLVGGVGWLFAREGEGKPLDLIIQDGQLNAFFGGRKPTMREVEEAIAQARDKNFEAEGVYPPGRAPAREVPGELTAAERGGEETRQLTAEELAARQATRLTAEEEAEFTQRGAPTGSYLAEARGQPLGSHPLERALSATPIFEAEPAHPPRSRTVDVIARELRDRGLAALRAMGVRGGKVTGPDPVTDEILSRTIAGEIKTEIDRGGGASTWYTQKIEQAIAIASLIHPEIATEPNARFAFTAALAITSQGERVPNNVRLAEWAYDYYKNHTQKGTNYGEFPTAVNAKNGPAMNKNFAKLNQLLRKGGPDYAREFLAQEFTVRDLEKVFGQKITGELKSANVRGSTILGPKIGGGFYQNLNNNYDPVTVDLWFMRAWGRLTGTLMDTASEEGLAEQRERLVTALREEGRKMPARADGLDRAAGDIVKTHERDFAENRALYDSGESVKSELTLAAESYLHGRYGIREQPRGGAERQWIRERVNRARELLAGEGIHVTNADLQAIWWYPEKELYAKMGGEGTGFLNVDYAGAFGDLARKRGISDERIEAAIRAVGRGPGPAESEAAQRGGPGAALPRVEGAQGEGARPSQEIELEQRAAAPQRPRTRGIPASAEPVVSSYRDVSEMTSNPHYEAAKAGDSEAARQFVVQTVRPATLEAARRRFGSDAVFVPVHAEEAAGRNKIPMTLAHYYAAATGGEVAEDIVQASRAYHTGMRPLERLVARPGFDGPVEPGRRYVLVDDVTTMGNTLAELAHHIQEGGGEVAGIVTLANAGRTEDIVARPARTRSLEKNLGESVRQELGIEPGALTASETEYLLGIRDADALRNSVAKARRERGERLRAKGLRPSEGEGLEQRGGQIVRGRFSPRTPEEIAAGQRPVERLSPEQNVSTPGHEKAHQFLFELARDAVHERAPQWLKDDWAAALEWLGAKNQSELFERTARGAWTDRARGFHEKFARGFEAWRMEGRAPSAALARIFKMFYTYLRDLYDGLQGLERESAETGGPERIELTDRMREVYGHLYETPEELRWTVITPEREHAPSMAGTHREDAALIEPQHAEPAADRVAAERRTAHEVNPNARPDAETEVATQPGGEGGGVPGGAGAIPAGAPQREAHPGAGGVLPGPGDERERLVPPAREGEGVAGRGTAPAAPAAAEESRAHLDDQPLAPGPADTLEGRETFNVGKKNNVRTENITSVPQFMEAIEESKDRIPGTDEPLTRGQMRDAAEAMGFDPDTLTLSMLERAFGGIKDLGKKVLAFRMAVREQAERVGDLMRRIRDMDAGQGATARFGAVEGPMADLVAEYAKERDRFDMFMSVLSSVSTEWGRTGRAFGNMDGWDEVRRLGLTQVVRNRTGSDLFQLKMEAVLGAQLKTQAQVAKYLRDARKRSFGGMLLEYFVNNLISGPLTHGTYYIGNKIERQFQTLIEVPVAAGIGLTRQALGRVGERVYLGELGAREQAILQNLPKRWQAGLEGLRTGRPVLLPGQEAVPATPFLGDTQLYIGRTMQPAPVTYGEFFGDLFGAMKGLQDGILGGAALIAAGGRAGTPLVGAHFTPGGQIPDITLRGVPVLPVGSLVRAPGRVVSAIHSMDVVTNERAETAALAYREATDPNGFRFDPAQKGRGLEGSERAEHIARRLNDPPVEWMKAVHERAYAASLMAPGGEFVRRLSALLNAEFNLPLLGLTKPMKFIDPFVHIGANVISKTVIQRTPVGILSQAIRDDLMGRNGNIAQDTTTARMLAGTALAITFGSLAMEGYITGSGPSDPNQARAWREVYQPHSVKIGNMWYQMNRLGSLGMHLGIAADLYEVARDISEGDALSAAAHLQHAITQNILDESFMKGPSDLIKAVEDPGRYGENYLKNMVGAFMPFSVGMYQMNRAADPYTRQARTVMDAILQRIPGQSQYLQPRINIYGEPMPGPTAVPGTSIYEQQVNRDPVRQAALDYNFKPAMPERKIRNVELTDEQYTEFATLAGRLLHQRLDMFVRSPDWRTWPAWQKHYVMEETLRQSREVAIGAMFARHPQIARDAALARREKITGEPAPIR